MKPIFSERNIIVILFIIVLVAFTFAQEDSRKIEKLYTGVTATTASHLLADQNLQKAESGNIFSSAPAE